GYADSEDIIAGINEAGIYQYILKPWVPEHLLQTVRQAVEASTLQHGLQRLELELRAGVPALRARRQQRLGEARSTFGFDRMVRAPGSPLDALCERAARVARYDLSVLLLGESGTGKELLARAIHYASPRHAGAFVVENCAAIPDNLLESELFGHKRGAFTGAVDDHVGLFQRADGGTVFLDEVGDTSPSFQVKLLRVLQEGEVRPVGSARSVPVDVRVVAATHRPLLEDVRAGRFREDLYYRVNGLTLQLPALRARSDQSALVAALLREIEPHRTLTLSPPLSAAFAGHAWPGNLRQLSNALRTACALLADGETQIDWPHLPDDLAEELAAARQTPTVEDPGADLRLQAERCIEQVLRSSGGNMAEAARRLGISRNTLYRRLRLRAAGSPTQA
ncbi:MAG: sigma-54-dependent Fis family transcriptional regulator, partial [Burkholderiales bacterium]|nr:sigma-54-dependent Fis family transcriptional regulator [Burkholderiales bacterium]